MAAYELDAKQMPTSIDTQLLLQPLWAALSILSIEPGCGVGSEYSGISKRNECTTSLSSD